MNRFHCRDSRKNWCLSAALLLCAAPAWARAPEAIDEGGKETVPPIKLNLQPARATVPALKYRLLPELRDLKPGNCVISYYRSFSPEWQYFQRDKDFWRAYEKWGDDKSKPPPRELEFVKNFHALGELDIGARRAYCDWEMIDRLRKDGIAMLLPDMQSFRTYSVLLAARARFEMMDRKLDRSLYTLQTGFTLGRHVSEGPTLIQALVGAAVTNQMIEELEYLLQQPGAPNLYWTLTDLPRPFIDLRKAIQGERIVIDALFPGFRDILKDPLSKPLSSGEVKATLDRTQSLESLLSLQNAPRDNWGARVVLATLLAKTYPEARKFLLDQGRSRELVDDMSVAQVSLLLEIYNFDRFYEDMMKWYGQPYSIMRGGVNEAVKQLKLAKADMTAGTFLATLLVPAAEKVMLASYRIDRKLAGLRCIEAIRMYAASHDGKLPASLKDINEVPVPVDPITDRPFEYALTPGGALLSAPPPPGFPLLYAWSFAITMQKP